MIDFHVHMGNLYREGYPARPPLNVDQLIDWMNRSGIEIGVLLPLESPEGSWGYFLNEEAVAARNAYPRRLIAFLCVDPRYPMAEAHIDYFVEKHGCKGFGEHVNGLAFDDPRNLRIYAKCNEHRLPLVFEISPDLCFDDPGLPKLENCLKQFPHVTFVGHGPAFWSAISADDPRSGYPKGPIKPGGAVDRLMAAYPNLYADLSAGSGHNAMTRDPDFTLGFIERNWQRLLWGTDIVGVHDNPPQIEWIRSVPIREEWRRAIQEENARRVLNLA
ncbi:MAG TPA: amidohydrolase family protein [Candidatus Hydrogenedentes bacterium]|nr:amidohydrolase family protein [Candidatus Hydrogenedentota bacterium]HOV73088.1 amidohydrolase family protein [Candidatus Hydrogenedentota bacterium]HPC16188.1 amidohydrolase family protein [Candidatus Hydrogenedentota bacterium]HRT18600.1 amidohydrolase family protein [Candidatus Hydrogenedentota bacterium]HRT63619.1 amidohydrolase family protein [Candidatus Hydrogenedentota bacterium]